MIHRGTYDGTIYHNPANRFCIISVKTADKEVPQEARSTRRYRDHLIRFVATGYELPRTDAVELELDGEWKQGKYGMQLQVEQWREIIPRTKSGVEGYLASGLIKGIGPATAALIVARFGEDTLDILQNHPERLLEIKGIKASVVMTEYHGLIYLSARSIDEVNVQVMMEKLGGGGHRTIAGAQLSGISMDEAKDRVKAVIDEMLQKGDIS